MLVGNKYYDSKCAFICVLEGRRQNLELLILNNNGEREGERQRDRERERQRERERDKETERERDKETEREREAKRERQRERQRDKETERETVRERHRYYSYPDTVCNFSNYRQLHVHYKKVIYNCPMIIACTLLHRV